MATTKLNLAPVRTCGPAKHRFPSKQAARAAADYTARCDARERPTAGPVNTYWCRACGAWHVGHKH